MGLTLRRALLDIAFLAMLLHALMPAGWMPGPASDGAISFVICSADGLHHLDGRDGQKNSADHQHDACPFAAAPHAVTSPVVAKIALPSHALLGEASFAALHAVRASTAYQPQSPRAPPISA